MPIPSGNGTEVLKRHQANGINNAYETLTVPSDHIFTLLSMSLCNYESAGSASSFILFGFQPNGSGDCWLIADQPIGGRQTFVYNDKVVFTGGDVIRVWSDSTNFDICISYIDQDWDSS